LEKRFRTAPGILPSRRRTGKSVACWRRQYPKRFHVDLEKHLSVEEYQALHEDQKDRVSREPLNPEDIKALVDTAINLHSRALESEHARKWWIPLASSAIGGLLGAILGVFLHAK
jgi:hypothetical protein